MRPESLLVTSLVALLWSVPAAANRDGVIDWLESAIDRETRVQAAFMEAAFGGHSGDLPVPDAGDRAYYNTSGLSFSKDVTEANRVGYVSALEEEMQRASLDVFEVQSVSGTVRFSVPFGRNLRFAALPVTVIAAAATVAGPKERGAERDLVVPGEPHPHWMTAKHELDGRLIVRTTSNVSVAASESSPSAADLSERFGIGPLVDGDAAWSARERAALATALARVPPHDLAVLAGLPFRRFVDPPADLSDAAAYYRQSGAERSVDLFDASFAEDDNLFVGEPEAPFSHSLRVLLHEIGHAVAYEKPYKAVHGLIARYESLALLHQHLGELELSGIRSERERLRTILEQLHDLRRPLGRFRQAAKGGTLNASPVHTAFVEATGGYGPTPYGQTKLSEAFAESYMLFLLDPDALDRIDPAALTFFRSGAYQLEPLHVEPVPEVPRSVQEYLEIPEDEAFDDELDALLEDEVGPLE